MQTLLLSDWSLFFGRFHPLVVHLPIGILILAILLEWWPGQRMRRAARIAWLLGSLSAVVAALFGWLLAEGNDGGYGGDTLFWHRWLGIGLALTAVGGYFLTSKQRKVNRYYGLLVGGLLFLAGHQGGNLTHGPSYLLEHAPGFVQSLSGYEATEGSALDSTSLDPDSINLFTTFIQPSLDKTCVRCHNANKQNGGLRMDTPSWLFIGGDNGSIVTSGNPMESEWVKRVTLPRSNPKAMPPQGMPLSFTDIRLLTYWIAAGADTSFLLDLENLPEDIPALLLRDYGVDLSPKTFVEKLDVPSLSADALSELTARGWAVNPLSDASGVLEASPQAGVVIDGEALAFLAEKANQQVVWLSLQDQSLSGAYENLTQFQHLNRLKLNGSDVEDKDLQYLTKLEALASINLYNTGITDAGLQALASITPLRKLYLWQSNASDDAIANLREARTDLEVNTGFRFATTNIED